MLHLAIADDHSIMRNGLAGLLNSEDGLHVGITAENGLDLILQLERTNQLPDVCILDISMPGMDGFETITVLKHRWPNMGVLVLTIHEVEHYFIRMIMRGANGYLHKGCSHYQIGEAVLAIKQHGMYYADAEMRRLVKAIQNREITEPGFTECEIELLKWACTDLTYKEIAHNMAITVKSVEGHKESLFKKLNVGSRQGLVIAAIRLGYILIDTKQ